MSITSEHVLIHTAEGEEEVGEEEEEEEEEKKEEKECRQISKEMDI